MVMSKHMNCELVNVKIANLLRQDKQHVSNLFLFPSTKLAYRVLGQYVIEAAMFCRYLVNLAKSKFK